MKFVYQSFAYILEVILRMYFMWQMDFEIWTTSVATRGDDASRLSGSNLDRGIIFPDYRLSCSSCEYRAVALRAPPTICCLWRFSHFRPCNTVANVHTVTLNTIPSAALCAFHSITFSSLSYCKNEVFIVVFLSLQTIPREIRVLSFKYVTITPFRILSKSSKAVIPYALLSNQWNWESVILGYNAV
jgi:hypothetical protein